MGSYLYQARGPSLAAKVVLDNGETVSVVPYNCLGKPGRSHYRDRYEHLDRLSNLAAGRIQRWYKDRPETWMVLSDDNGEVSVGMRAIKLSPMTHPLINDDEVDHQVSVGRLESAKIVKLV